MLVSPGPRVSSSSDPKIHEDGPSPRLLLTSASLFLTSCLRAPSATGPKVVSPTVSTWQIAAVLAASMQAGGGAQMGSVGFKQKPPWPLSSSTDSSSTPSRPSLSLPKFVVLTPSWSNFSHTPHHQPSLDPLHSPKIELNSLQNSHVNFNFTQNKSYKGYIPLHFSPHALLLIRP